MIDSRELRDALDSVLLSGFNGKVSVEDIFDVSDQAAVKIAGRIAQAQSRFPLRDSVYRADGLRRD